MCGSLTPNLTVQLEYFIDCVKYKSMAVSTHIIYWNILTVGSNMAQLHMQLLDTTL